MSTSQQDVPEQGAFHVRLSPTVLRQLGYVPADIFRQVQRRLASLATFAESSGPVEAECLGPSALGFARTRFCFTVEDFVAVYRAEADRRTLTLLEIARRLPGAAEI